MQTPNFANNQFVDQNALNTAFGAVSGSVATLASVAYAAGGLLYPEQISYSASGMVVTVTVPAPAGLLTAPSGIVAQAHGTVTGSDTQTYSVDFTSLVPGSGSVTAYLIATASTVPQNPVGVPGPPPGHPSYDPTFVPTISYQATTDTLALSASTSTPNNGTAFELARTTLTAGQSTLPVSSLDVSHQKRATGYDSSLPVTVNGSYVLPTAYPGATFIANAAGYTSTLPGAAASAGLSVRLVNPTGGGWTIAAGGSDTITGVLGGAALTSTVLAAGSAAVFWSDGAAWRCVATSITGILGNLLMSHSVISGNYTIQQSDNNTLIEAGGTGTITFPPGLQQGTRVCVFTNAGATTFAVSGANFYGNGVFQTTPISAVNSFAYWFFFDGANWVITSAPYVNSPAFTGTPTAPTAATGTNTTQIATTAFVASSIAPLAPLASPAFTGTPTAPTPAAGTNNTDIATTAFVAASYAPLASPSFTGTVSIPTLNLAGLSGFAMYSSGGNPTLNFAANNYIQVAAGGGSMSFSAGSTAMVLNSSGQLVVAAASADNQAVNLGQFPGAFATNGSQELPGGFILQWGQATVTAQTALDVTLPTAFPNAILGGGATYDATASPPASGPLGVRLLSTTQVQLYSAAASGSYVVHWMAWGY